METTVFLTSKDKQHQGCGAVTAPAVCLQFPGCKAEKRSLNGASSLPELSTKFKSEFSGQSEGKNFREGQGDLQRVAFKSSTEMMIRAHA